MSLDQLLALPRVTDPALVNDWPPRALGLVPPKSPDHARDVGSLEANLAASYRMTGRHADAASRYRHSLELLERAYGEDHALVARVRNELVATQNEMDGRAAINLPASQ